MRGIINELTSHKGFYGLLCVIFVLAAATRLWHVGEVPFVADEFLDVNATYGYHKTGQWQAWDFNHDAPSVRDNAASDRRAWMYRVQVAFLYRFLPPTETTVRLVSVLWGIVTTGLLYGVGVHMTKRRWVGLIAAFLWAVSVPAIEINRTVRMYSMFAPVFLLFWWSTFQFFEARKDKINGISAIFRFNWWYVVPMLLLGALAYHLHPLAGMMALVAFVYFCVMMIVSRKTSVKRYHVYVALCVLGGASMWFLAPSVWQKVMGMFVFFDNHWHYVGHVLRHFWHPLMGGTMIVCGACAAVQRDARQKAGVWLVVTFVTIVASAIFLWNRNVGPQYIFFVQPFGLLLCAIGVDWCARWVSARVQTKNAFLWTVGAFMIFLPFYGYFFLENTTYHITSSGDQAHYRKVFDYVRRNATAGDAMITRNFRNYYWHGLDMPVYDFGTERSAQAIQKEGKVQKVTVAHIENIVSKHPHGWIVFSDNDTVFITKEARAYCDAHFTEVTNSPLVRGKVHVYRWSVQ